MSLNCACHELCVSDDEFLFCIDIVTSTWWSRKTKTDSLLSIGLFSPIDLITSHCFYNGQTHTHSRNHSHTHSHNHTHAHTYTHTHTHTLTLIHTHTHTHTQAHTHTHSHSHTPHHTTHTHTDFDCTISTGVMEQSTLRAETHREELC